MVTLLLVLHILCVLLAQLLLLRFNLSRQETKWRAQLVNKDSNLLKDSSVVLDLRGEHVDLGVPLEHFVLHVGDLQSQFGG